MVRTESLRLGNLVTLGRGKERWRPAVESLRFRNLAALALLVLAAAHAAAQSAPQPLSDYRRVVVADDALPVQRAAAEELANYAGRIAGRKMEIITQEKLAADAPGLSF